MRYIAVLLIAFTISTVCKSQPSPSTPDPNAAVAAKAVPANIPNASLIPAPSTSAAAPQPHVMSELFIPLVPPLMSAALAAFLTYLFTSRARRDEAIIRFKEEKYAKLLVKLQGFVGTTVSAKLKREFFEEQYQSWLYASDEVVEAINALVQLVINNRGDAPDPEAGRKAVGEIVLAMRRDLLKNTSLSYKSFRYTDVRE
ncbi:MAG: hypothetical protein Q7T18_01190 [Sedimentisphaerales bacterium]|nr:hypothetical protein [Sedimentisphaerales bacterium]